jgi:hypothetical protein
MFAGHFYSRSQGTEIAWTKAVLNTRKKHPTTPALLQKAEKRPIVSVVQPFVVPDTTDFSIGINLTCYVYGPHPDEIHSFDGFSYYPDDPRRLCVAIHK